MAAIIPFAGRLPTHSLPGPLDVELGGRIAAIRAHQGMSIAQLATRAGLELDVVSKCESGAMRITAEIFVRIAKALGVSATEILNDTDQA